MSILVLFVGGTVVTVAGAALGVMAMVIAFYVMVALIALLLVLAVASLFPRRVPPPPRCPVCGTAIEVDEAACPRCGGPLR